MMIAPLRLLSAIFMHSSFDGRRTKSQGSRLHLTSRWPTLALFWVAHPAGALSLSDLTSSPTKAEAATSKFATLAAGGAGTVDLSASTVQSRGR